MWTNTVFNVFLDRGEDVGVGGGESGRVSDNGVLIMVFVFFKNALIHCLFNLQVLYCHSENE